MRRSARLTAAGLILASLVAVVASPVRGDEELPTDRKPGPGSVGGGSLLNALLEPIRASNDVPALAALILTSEGVVAEGAVGFRKRGDDARVSLFDRWHIGSCTKSITATLIGRLVEKKKLRWDTTLAEAFPDLAKTMHEGWRKVTLEQLLRHRGGMPKDLGRDGLWAKLWQTKKKPREARRLLTETVLSWPPRHAPDTTYEYSNGGYAVVGHAAETMLDTPYEKLLFDELLLPLKATPAGFGAPGARDPGLAHPWGHRLLAKERPGISPRDKQSDNPPAITPAGRLHMTMRAWAHYARLHLRGAQDGDDELLLERDTLRHIQTPREGEQYALGWGVAKRAWAGGRTLTHNGSNTLWFAVAWLAPKRDFAVLVACNQGGDPGAMATDEAAAACIRWYAARANAQKRAKEVGVGR